MSMNSSVTLECADTKTAGSSIRTGKIVVNLGQRLVTVDGNPVKLTQREYKILELLSSRKGTIVTKEMFLDRLYAGGHEPEHKIIDIFSVSCDKSWHRQPAEAITSRRCGVAAMFCEARPNRVQAQRDRGANRDRKLR
jgi:DNA-binding response OmpR family regulator